MDVLQFLQNLKRKGALLLKNMINEIRNAKSKNGQRSKIDLNNFVQKIKDNYQEIIIDWDKDSGENWASILYQNSLISLLNSAIPLAFTKSIILDKDYMNLLTCEFHCVMSDDFDLKEWTINLNALSSLETNLEWHASDYAVDLECFSINQFWFATI